jgi:choice-of-anchor C domain-containing protein
MHKAGALFLVCVGIVSCAAPVRAGTSLIVNGSFETPYVDPTWVNYWNAGQSYGGWTVGSGSIDQIAQGDYAYTYNWQAADGVQSLDMTGLGSAGTMYQDVATSPGAVYELRFALAGNYYVDPAIKTLRVWWEGSIVGTYTFDVTGKTQRNMGWTYVTAQFVGSGGLSRLTFESLTPGYYGPALDDVSLRELTVPVQAISIGQLKEMYAPPRTAR